MVNGAFTEEDKSKVIEFLNMVATQAELRLNTQQVINYFRLLQHMQGVIIPKIESNILEVVKVVETKEPPKTE